MKTQSVSRKAECTIPVLPVRNLDRSINFYKTQLNFRLDWRSDGVQPLCSLSRNGVAIMLVETTSHFAPVWIWIGQADDSLFEESREYGVTSMQESHRFPWDFEMKFTDPDGNVLWYGTGIHL